MASRIRGARVTIANFLVVIGTMPGSEPLPSIPLDKEEAKALLSASAKDGLITVCFSSFCTTTFNNGMDIYRAVPLIHQADTVQATPHLFHHDVQLHMPDGDMFCFAILNRHSPA